MKTEKMLVETVSSFVLRYVIEVEKGDVESAKRAVTDLMADDEWQVHIGQSVVNCYPIAKKDVKKLQTKKFLYDATGLLPDELKDKAEQLTYWIDEQSNAFVFIVSNETEFFTVALGEQGPFVVHTDKQYSGPDRFSKTDFDGFVSHFCDKVP
jgi:hypothetical protein